MTVFVMAYKPSIMTTISEHRNRDTVQLFAIRIFVEKENEEDKS